MYHFYESYVEILSHSWRANRWRLFGFISGSKSPDDRAGAAGQCVTFWTWFGAAILFFIFRLLWCIALVKFRVFLLERSSGWSLWSIPTISWWGYTFFWLEFIVVSYKLFWSECICLSGDMHLKHLTPFVHNYNAWLELTLVLPVNCHAWLELTLVIASQLSRRRVFGQNYVKLSRFLSNIRSIDQRVANMCTLDKL